QRTGGLSMPWSASRMRWAMRAGRRTAVSVSAIRLWASIWSRSLRSVTASPWKTRSPVSSSMKKAGQWSPPVSGSMARNRSRKSSSGVRFLRRFAHPKPLLLPGNRSTRGVSRTPAYSSYALLWLKAVFSSRITSLLHAIRNHQGSFPVWLEEPRRAERPWPPGTPHGAAPGTEGVRDDAHDAAHDHAGHRPAGAGAAGAARLDGAPAGLRRPAVPDRPDRAPL